MVKWKEQIDLRKPWDKAMQRTIKIPALASEVVHHLERLKAYKNGDTELQRLVDEFREISEDDVTDEDELREEFDYVWEGLYDWADDGHRLWIRLL